MATGLADGGDECDVVVGPARPGGRSFPIGDGRWDIRTLAMIGRGPATGDRHPEP